MDPKPISTKAPKSAGRFADNRHSDTSEQHPSRTIPPNPDRQDEEIKVIQVRHSPDCTLIACHLATDSTTQAHTRSLRGAANYPIVMCEFVYLYLVYSVSHADMRYTHLYYLGCILRLYAHYICVVGESLAECVITSHRPTKSHDYTTSHHTPREERLSNIHQM